MEMSDKQEPLFRFKYQGLKWLKLVLIILISTGITAGIFGWFFRDNLLQWAIQKVGRKLHRDFQCELYVKKAQFSGVATLELFSVSIVPHGKDTLFTMDKFTGILRVWPLIQGDVQFSSLKPSKIKLNLFKDSLGNSNFQGLIKKQKSEENQQGQPSGGKALYRAIHKLFDQIPSDFAMDEWITAYSNGENSYQMIWNACSLKDGNAFGICKIVTPERKHDYSFAGTFDPDEMKGDFSIKSAQLGDTMQLPLALEKFGLNLQAGKLNVKLLNIDYEDENVKVKWAAGYENVKINHKRLSDKDVLLPYGSGEFHCRFNATNFILDSSSILEFEKIKAHPFVQLQRKPVPDYSLKLFTESMDAQSFFSSLPQGMFESLDGIRVAGKIDFYLDFHLNDTVPYQCHFDAGIHPSNFKVISYGSQHLPKINGPLWVTQYEYGRPARTIDVSESNPDFWPISEIHPYIIQSVITSEDPGFYGHRGFEMEAVRQSIAQNYIAKKFVRGASTLTMQLVKNVFLSRKKTMARKVEEMLIVWIIENLGITSKSRMLEVYLNIIEWGPGVYGIGEACRFYFNKTPHDVFLNEAIFLSSVIPSPKSFAWVFTDSASIMRKDWQNHIGRMAKIMAARHLIEESDTTDFNTDVRLKGPAVKKLRKRKNMASDSIPEEPDELLIFREPEY